MANAKRKKVREEDVTGLKYFDRLAPLLERLHDDGCGRDKAGNRKLHFDQYCMRVLLYLFSPSVSSLRAIQQTIALIYRYRWTIEIFFRFFKHILGCRHLLSHDQNGIALLLASTSARGVLDAARNFIASPACSPRQPSINAPRCPIAATSQSWLLIAIAVPNRIGSDPFSPLTRFSSRFSSVVDQRWCDHGQDHERKTLSKEPVQFKRIRWNPLAEGEAISSPPENR